MEERIESETAPWFEKGLRFTCTGCGKCCTGSPGYVFLSSMDLENLARHFSLPRQDFMARYTQRLENKIALLDRSGSDHCIFLLDKQCTVYEARPVQCRTFPWWVYHLYTPDDWEDAKTRCEGIDHPDAALISSLHIQEQCLTYLDNLLEQNFNQDPF